MQQKRASTEYDPAKILAERKRERAHSPALFIKGAATRSEMAGARNAAPCADCPHAPHCATRLWACEQFERFVDYGPRRSVWVLFARIPSRVIYERIFPGATLRAPGFYRHDFGDHPAESLAAKRLRAENLRRHRKVYPVTA